MKYVIDKNTNRIIFMTDGDKFLLDAYTYLVEAPAFEMNGVAPWKFKWSAAKNTFYHAPDKKKK